MHADCRRQNIRALGVVPALAIVLALVPAISRPAAAATTIGTFSVGIVIQATCQVASTATLDVRIAVQCTQPTPFNVALDESSPGVSAATRTTTSAIAAVSYEMSSSPADASNGNTIAVQSAPGSNTQRDTVRVTITY